MNGQRSRLSRYHSARAFFPLLAIAAFASARLFEFAPLTSFQSEAHADEEGDDYDAGWWAGYDDGYAGLPPADTSGQSTDYQDGYAEGYDGGVMDAETQIDESSSDDYDTGWWAGYDDGYAGLPPADTSGQSTDYQDGYAEGYDGGVMDAETQIETTAT